MSARRLAIAAGVFAATGVAILLLDRRNAAAAGAVTPEQAGAVATSSLGWWSPFIPLQLQTAVARGGRADTVKV